MSLSPAASASSTAIVQTAWREHEADLGDEAVMEGSFTIMDADITADSQVVVLQAAAPYTGKGTLPDEALMDQVMAFAVPGSGSATVYWRALSYARLKGFVRFDYTVG